MSFAWPQFLWLLLLPLGLLVWEITRRRRVAASGLHPKIRRAEIAHHALSVVDEPTQTAATRLRPWLALGLAFTVVALARPQWGRLEEPVFDQSREILIAIDLSRSMQAPDVKPSRLDRAKLLVQALLERLQGERVGLVVFSGTAFLQSPLSADYEILREFLPSLNPDFLPEGGTNYSALISTALDAFGSGSAADRFLIVLSDGEATDDNWRSSIEELKKKGIRVISLGLGTSGGSMIPDGSGGFVKDQRGAVVLSKLENATLQELASATHGVYRDASAWINLASLIEETVNEGRKGDFVDQTTVRLVERFQWPLALALWCFLVSFYFEFPVRPRPREIALRAAGPRPPGTGPAKALGTAALILLSFGAFSASPAHAAVKRNPAEPPEKSEPTPPVGAPAGATGAPASPEPTPAPGEPAALGKIVSRLAQKDTLSSPDLSEFARETLNWGRRIKEAGRPVPDGPVRDALQAVDALEAKGGNLADWAQLRKDLEALREKPTEKKNPPQQKQPNEQKDKKDSSKDQQQQQGQQQDKNQSNGSDKDQKPSESDQKQGEPQKDGAQNQPSSPEQKQPGEKQNQPSAFGDMNKQPPPPPSTSPTQKVGGAPEKKEEKEPVDPALALPMQKLDQLRDQDSPGKLFQLMQPERSQASQKKPAKDW